MLKRALFSGGAEEGEATRLGATRHEGHLVAEVTDEHRRRVVQRLLTTEGTQERRADERRLHFSLSQEEPCLDETLREAGDGRRPLFRETFAARHLRG